MVNTVLTVARCGILGGASSISVYIQSNVFAAHG